MKIKLNSYVCEKFGKKSIFYENGVIFQDSSRPLPNQKKNSTKLMKVLESYSDDTDFRLKEPEMKVLRELQKSRKRTLRSKTKTNTTKKWFRW